MFLSVGVDDQGFFVGRAIRLSLSLLFVEVSYLVNFGQLDIFRQLRQGSFVPQRFYVSLLGSRRGVYRFALLDERRVLCALVGF